MRDAKHYSIRDVAKVTRLSVNTVWRIAQGQSVLHAKTAERIRRFMGLTPAAFAEMFGA